MVRPDAVAVEGPAVSEAGAVHGDGHGRGHHGQGHHHGDQQAVAHAGHDHDHGHGHRHAHGHGQQVAGQAQQGGADDAGASLLSGGQQAADLSLVPQEAQAVMVMERP